MAAAILGAGHRSRRGCALADPRSPPHCGVTLDCRRRKPETDRRSGWPHFSCRRLRSLRAPIQRTRRSARRGARSHGQCTLRCTSGDRGVVPPTATQKRTRPPSADNARLPKHAMPVRSRSPDSGHRADLEPSRPAVEFWATKGSRHLSRFRSTEIRGPGPHHRAHGSLSMVST